MNHQAEAERLLAFYLRRAFELAGATWDSDNDAEVGIIVELIVRAAQGS